MERNVKEGEKDDKKKKKQVRPEKGQKAARQWLPNFLTLKPLVQPLRLWSPQPKSYFCCYFITKFATATNRNVNTCVFQWF